MVEDLLPLDWFWLALTLVALVRGWMKGFSYGILVLAGFFAGIHLALQFTPDVLVALQQEGNLTALALIFLSIVLGCVAGASLLGWIIRSAFRKAHLGWLDTFLGGIFYAVLLWILILAGIEALTRLDPSWQNILQENSRILQWLLPHLSTPIVQF